MENLHSIDEKHLFFANQSAASVRDAYELALLNQERQFGKEKQALEQKLRAQMDANYALKKSNVALSKSQERKSCADKESRRSLQRRERSLHQKHERRAEEMQKRHYLEKEIWIATLEEARR